MMQLKATTLGFGRVCAVALTACLLAGCVTNSMLRERGYSDMAIKDYAAARDHFREAAHRDPRDHIAQYYVGITELHLGHPRAAQTALEQALEMRPHDESFTPKIIDALAAAIHRQDRPAELNSFLGDIATRYGTARDYLRHADYLVKIGDLDAAKVAYRKAAHFAEPGDVDPYLAIVDFYDTVGDRQNAVTALRYAYWVDPNEPSIPDRFRSYDLVPGPSLKLQPEKPEMLH